MTQVALDPSYASQQAWQDLQQYLPENYRIGPANPAPEESFWPWRDHRIHVERYARPQSPVKVILLHGVGTNGRQMSLILGAPLAQRGIETLAIDNLGYGLTQVSKRTQVRYADWVDLVVDFIDKERAADPRPIVLYGLSAGGMLAYHVAARTPVAGIVGMTFLDQRVQQVRDETAHDFVMSRVGVPVASLSTRIGLGGLPMPMKWASKMFTLVNDPGALKIALSDRTSGGNWVPLRFLASYTTYAPVVEPEDFRGCPILLTQPAEDRWTPLHLSEPFLARFRHVPTRVVMLDNAGHMPLEEPGLSQMVDAVEQFARERAAAA